MEESWDIVCISTSGHDKFPTYSRLIYPRNIYSQPLCEVDVILRRPCKHASVLLAPVAIPIARPMWSDYIFYLSHLIVGQHRLNLLPRTESVSPSTPLGTSFLCDVLEHQRREQLIQRCPLAQPSWHGHSGPHLRTSLSEYWDSRHNRYSLGFPNGSWVWWLRTRFHLF